MFKNSIKWPKFTWLVTFSMALTVILNLGLTNLILPASAQYRFSDVNNHWAKPCIEELGKRRILNGYRDGTFRPDASVTRAEFAAIVDTAFPKAKLVRKPIKFVDVPTNFWAAQVINNAYAKGFVNGFKGTLFQPDKNISRVDVLVGLATGLQYIPNQPISPILDKFIDAEDIPHYGRNSVAAATDKQLVVNYPDVKKIQPNKAANRGEIAASLCQALDLSDLVPSEYIANFKSKQLPYKNSEIRGVWLTNIDSNVLFSTQGVTKAIERLAQLNFNTIYPVVWNWGYTLYPSKVAEKAIGTSVRLVTPIDEKLDPNLGTKGRDMLQEMVKEGHKKGMAVIPWFEFGFMTAADSELAKLHPEWLTNRRDGSKSWMEGIHERVWLNPFHPEVQQFILDLITEIVSKYDVDGIQFDDHFGLPAEFGYDAYTVGMYQKEIKQMPSDNFQDTFWVRWRSDKLNQFMERVFQTIKARNNKCIISLSPNPLHHALPSSLQDWFTWERKGFIEELILQVYRNDLPRFITELEREEVKLANSHIPVGIGIITGLKGRAIPLTQIQAQVQAVRERKFAGVSFFFYESLSNWATETPRDREAGFKTLFPTPIPRSSLVTDS